MSRWIYIPAVLIGVAATLFLMPLDTLLGDGGLWNSPHGDTAQALTGHLAFQADAWRWPLLRAANLMWPHGLSIAMTDSNPLVSLVAKLLADLLGHPVNLLGLWFAACVVLQPVAAVYALRSTGCRSWEASLAVAILAICFPALLFRIVAGHVNLCGQFLLLFALGMVLRRAATGRGAVWRDWAAPCGLLTVAVLSHPYLFVFAALLLAAPAIEPLLLRRAGWQRFVLWYAVSVTLPVLVFLTLSGTLGGGERGFGFYSMNLLSPLWPQMSGLFGRNLPIIDATGGQYEGFNYLGAGLLLLISLASIILVRGKLAGRSSIDLRTHVPEAATTARGTRALVVVLLAFTGLALSTKVFAGKILLIPLGTKPWDQVFGIVQASGRAFWAVGYALMIGAVAVLARNLSRPVLAGVLAVAVGLQVADTAPLRADVRAIFAGRGESAAAFVLPRDATLLTTVPICPGTATSAETARALRLAGIRAGLRLSDITFSRSPKWFNCESALTDGLELPLRPKEVRVFLEPAIIGRLRTIALGRGTDCRQVAGLVTCTRDLSPIAGMPASPGPTLPVVTPPVRLSGEALAPLLSFGWHSDDKSIFWSQGPRVTLLFRLAEPGAPSNIHLQLEGVAPSPGGKSPIRVALGRDMPAGALLPDLRPSGIDIAVPANLDAEAIVRISFDVGHAFDPARRGLRAPVTRAGVRLLSVQVDRVRGASKMTNASPR